jgi:chemosensory pili system protein ChpA (sensor histidine kinase/response regulator)
MVGIIPKEPEILVVEDDPETLDLITIILERQDYRVVVAHDGLTALDVVALRNPSLIITDVRMPRIDGVELIRKVRAMGVTQRFTPILAVTAFQLEHATEAIEAGASHVLGKPFDEHELIACVKDLLAPGSAKAHPRD